MAAFGDRRLLARAGTALLLANLRFWPKIAPRVKAQLARWEGQARTIEHPRLQALALQKLAEEHFNAQVAATLATLSPPGHRQAVVEAIVAYEVMYDYLDGLTEQPDIDPLTAGRELFQAFIDAISGDRPARCDYYRSLPFDDSGYLQRLATAVQDALTSLPSSVAIQEVATRAATRCAEAQLRAHAATTLGPGQVEAWAKSQAPTMHLDWQEFLLGSASSVLAVHALIAAATEPTTVEQAREIDAAYLSICALSTMLDSLVDYQRDQQDEDQGGYLRYYQSTSQLAQALAAAARRSAMRARTLPHGDHHAMTLTGVAAYYLSAPTAQTEPTRQATRSVRAELMPLIVPTLAVMRAWRAAKRARKATRDRRLRRNAGSVR